MFKPIKFNNIGVLMSLYTNKPISVYSNKLNTNLINLKVDSNFKYLDFSCLTEFSYIFAVDIACTHNTQINTIFTNNLFYNYKHDRYINIINHKTQQLSLVNFFFNRVWLEREVFESFNVWFFNLLDTRPLLLNYGDNVSVLLKNNSVQPNSELKTVWHFRKLSKFNNSNVEL